MPKLGRKRRVVLWVLLILFAMVVGRIVWVCLDDAPREVVASRETTHLTGPLNPDGTVNYVAAINARFGEGVTTENNAAVLVLRAAGPEALVASVRPKVYALLGMKALPTVGKYFIPLAKHAVTNQPSATGAAEAEMAAQDAMDRCLAGTATAQQVDSLVGWIQANAKPLALAVDASRRTRFYVPHVPREDPPRLTTSRSIYITKVRSLAVALAARAEIKVRGGDLLGSWDDLLACVRLGRLVGQLPDLISQLLSVNLQSQGCRGMQRLAGSGKLTSAQAKRMLRELADLPKPLGVAESVNGYERLECLDSVSACSRPGGVSKLLGPNYYAIVGTTIDWNKILRRFNAEFDLAYEAACASTPAEGRPAWTKMEPHLENVQEDLDDPAKAAKLRAMLVMRMFFWGRRRVSTEAMGDLLLGTFLASFENAHAWGIRGEMDLVLTRAALGLAAFKADKGEYPRKLSELCPAYLSAIPDDLFADAPLQYRPTGSGYLLYSVGINEKDEGGLESADLHKGDMVVKGR